MDPSYKPGLVSATLFSKNKISETRNKTLDNLFAAKKSNKILAGTSPTTSVAFTATSSKADKADLNKENGTKPVKKKKLKKKKKANAALGIPMNSTTVPFVSTHQASILQRDSNAGNRVGVKRKLQNDKTDDDEFEGKRPRRDRKRDKMADSRTIFVGNCPLSADKKVLKKLFKEYGDIETIRFRCAPAAEPDLPRRAIVITKNFHEKCNNYVAYVVFKEEDSAKKALERNGYVLDGLHLRVDIAAMFKKHDKKRSIFVGNLPFTITEEELRDHFEDCGEIINVRVVRDRQTNLGKGICYVQFESKDSVSLALKLNKSELQGRPIRVMVCTNKEKKKKPKKVLKDEGQEVKKQKSDDKPKRIAFAPSNISKVTFKAKMQAKKDKRFRKIKKKKENSKKSDGLTSIFGPVAPIPTKSKINKAKSETGSGKKSKKTTGGHKKLHQKGSSFKGKGKGGED
ncbi:RNA-binding protein 34-like [Physella acuta]|uniref:RNA-binding protein 34-like n=1 Tax=Physella acuta TaxID=109671 RepID=UPI0027DB7AFF|nr:RNA-binding protein 34-like [Physella acuta]XP_059146198.1 RNA-binding protein 34-like [Physella acuta]